MSATNAELKREVRRLRSQLHRLARLFYTHARTDLAPDACLPMTRKLLAELGRK